MSTRTARWPAGSPCWVDLTVPDVAAAKEFYAGVLGYRMDPLADAGPEYATFHQPGEDFPLAGMGGMMGADDAPAHWLVYFGVASVDAAVAAAEPGGGTVAAPAVDSAYGRTAGIADPAGAVFWVIETDADTQPDRSG